MRNVNVMLRAPSESKSPLDRSDPRWRQLHNIIEQESLQRGSFKLSSGRESNFLFQLRQTTLKPVGQFLLGTIIVEFMRHQRIATVGGLEVGAVPLISAVSFASHLEKYPVDAFFVRKKAKEHGAKELVDGHLKDGADVLFVDDVTTTGGSILNAIDKVEKEAGRKITVRYALSVVDRQEGATELLATHGITLVSLFTKQDFGL
jgi:orotate phosphoribosyltransferase